MIAGLILAGGEARRMGGGDKPLLAIGRRTLLDLIIDRLRPQVAALALSANGDPTRFRHFGLPVLPDAEPGLGPLAGLRAGLAWAERLGATVLLTVPGDTPFIPTDLAARLGQPPARAASASGTHHLVAIWPVRGLIERLDQPGSRSVGDFATGIGSRVVRFDDTPDPFLNLNTPDDLARAADR